MAHMIEANDSMFSVRQKPWHFAETEDRCKIIQEAPKRICFFGGSCSHLLCVELRIK